MAASTFKTSPAELVGDTNQLLLSLNIIEDPRISRGKLHPLINILVITLIAVGSGACSWGHIAYYGTLHQAWFAQHLDLKNGIPSHDTFSRVFGLLSPQTVEQALQIWSSTRPGATRSGRQIAFDGKRLRGASQWQEEENSVHIVNAYCPEEGVTIGQTMVKNKQHEISAIPALINQLDLRGAICSGDAAFTQKEIVKQLKSAGADYCLALKDNQLNFRTAVEGLFGGHFPSTMSLDTIEKNRGRIERRKIWVSHHVERLKGHEEWAGLQSVIRLESQRGEGAEIETRHYICSLKPKPEEALKIVRKHWGVENGLHRTLDVYFHEDQWQNRAKIAAANLSVIRKIAGTILGKLDPKIPLVYKMTALSSSDSFRTRFINFEF